MPADPDDLRCEPLYDEDGQVIAHVQVSPDISDEGRVALGKLVDAARIQFAADLAADPSIGERQAAAVARIRRRAGLPNTEPPEAPDA